MILRSFGFIIISMFVIFFLDSCDENHQNNQSDKVISEAIKRNNSEVEAIKIILSQSIDAAFKIDNNISLLQSSQLLQKIYSVNHFLPIWSDTGKWKNYALDLIDYIDTSAYDGLFRQDYHYQSIKKIYALLKHNNYSVEFTKDWAKADVLMTDAFVRICQDLKQGRLQSDSLLWISDTSRFSNFFYNQIQLLNSKQNIFDIFDDLQPDNSDYRQLKKALKPFVKKMDNTNYTHLDQGFTKNDEKDSLLFYSNIIKRLSEIKGLKVDSLNIGDSLWIAETIKKYQAMENLTVDGKISAKLIKRLNFTDKDKFNSIAVTLDRYKSYPQQMPEAYVWINLPAYSLYYFDEDSLSLYSKIVCGKPVTASPILNSNIKEIITYPTWTVPTSIIKKEMLPQLKMNPNYLSKKGLKLYDHKGTKVDPSSVNWKKYNKGIPYKIRQGSGDGNALGAIKFNFNNPFDVYLHDTNQRYLFSSNKRALSHGCIRVENWKKLALLMLRKDSVLLSKNKSVKSKTVDLLSRLEKKQKHTFSLSNQVPIFIGYFSCEGKGDTVVFHEDIYGNDEKLVNLYFKKNK